MDRGLGEQPFVGTVSIWLICLMFERRKRHGFKNKTLYRQLLEAFFGALLRFRYRLYRSNAPHRGGGFIGYGSEVPAPPIRRKMKHNMSKAEKQQFYSQKVQKDGTKIEDIPSEFRTIEVYVLALGNVENLAEKRHVVKLMIQDAKEYREAGMEEKAVVLESLKGLVFGKVTMQENPENRK